MAIDSEYPELEFPGIENFNLVDGVARKSRAKLPSILP